MNTKELTALSLEGLKEACLMARREGRAIDESDLIEEIIRRRREAFRAEVAGVSDAELQSRLITVIEAERSGTPQGVLAGDLAHELEQRRVDRRDRRAAARTQALLHVPEGHRVMVETVLNCLEYAEQSDREVQLISAIGEGLSHSSGSVAEQASAGFAAAVRADPAVGVFTSQAYGRWPEGLRLPSLPWVVTALRSPAGDGRAAVSNLSEVRVRFGTKAAAQDYAQDYTKNRTKIDRNPYGSDSGVIATCHIQYGD